MEMRQQALDTARKIGSQKDVIGALVNLANLVDLEGNSSGARKDYEDAIEIAREIGDKQQLATLQFDLAANYYTQGEYSAAAALYLNHCRTRRKSAIREESHPGCRVWDFFLLNSAICPMHART